MFLRVSPVQALWCVRQNSARGRLSTGTMGKLSSALSVCVLVAGLAGAAAFFRPSSVRAARTVMQEGKGFGKSKNDGNDEHQLLYYHQKKEAGVAEMLRFNKGPAPQAPKPAASGAPRVFEQTVQFPTVFEIKVIGEPGEAGGSEFETDMVKVVAEVTGKNWQEIAYSSRDTSSGKYRSLTIQAPVDSADQLYTVYEQISSDTRVRFKF